MKNSLLWAALALSPATVFADYQFELGGSYGQSDTTTTTKTHSPVFVGGTVVFTDRFKLGSDSYQLGGRLHFDTVATDRGPLAEAGFLSQSSFVDVRYTSVEPDDSTFEDSDLYRIAGRFVSDGALIVEMDYLDTHVGEQTDNDIRAGIGGYLNESTDLVISYQTSTDSDNDLEIVDAKLHGLAQLSGNNHLGYDVSVAYIDTGDDQGYGFAAGASYYFSPRVGLGLNASLEEVDEQESHGVGAMLSFFPAENIRLAALWFDQSTDVNDFIEAESDGFSVGISLRF